MVMTTKKKPTPFQNPLAVQQKQQAQSPMAKDQARLAGVQAAIGGLPAKNTPRPATPTARATPAPMVPTNNAGSTRAIGTVQTPAKPQLPKPPPAPAAPAGAVTSPALLRQAVAQRGGGSSGSAPGITNPYEQADAGGVPMQKRYTGGVTSMFTGGGGALSSMTQQANNPSNGLVYTPPDRTSPSNDLVYTPPQRRPPAPPPEDTAPWGDGGVLNPGTGAKPEAPQSMAELRDQAIRELLEGNVRDTSDEEALIRELMEAEMGANLVDARASMGRAGYASGGALYALEGDVRNKARQQALQEMFDVQRGARGEHREDISMGLEANADAEDRAFENWLRGELVKQGLADDEGPEGGGTGGPLDVNGDGIVSDAERGMDEDGDGEISAQERGRADVGDDRTFAEGAPGDAASYEDYTDSSPPWGYRTGDDGQYVYVVGLDGRKWRVPIGLYGV